MDYTRYVNTNIGTIGHLLTSTAPNVQSPHGAAVCAPVFRPGVKDRYISDRIYGFSAGGGIIMPLEERCADFMQNGSVFDHDFETAKPDYYAVMLEDTGIQAELTAYHNTGIFRFTGENCRYAAVYFKRCIRCETIQNRIVAAAALDEQTAMTGVYEFSSCEGFEVINTQTPGFYKPEIPDDTTVVLVKLSGPETIVKFALSAIGKESCEKSFARSVQNHSFEELRAQCSGAWNAVLSKIRVTGDDENRKTVFYTALYRALSRMHNYSVDGEYIGFDHQVHADGGHEYYSDDGIWDTYRGMHPLQMLLEPKVHSDILTSYLRTYEQGGWMARFPFLGGNRPCMLGFHTVSLFADALAKGFPFDLELAYKAAYKNAMERTMCPWKDGNAGELTYCYHEKGFFPALEEDEEETSAEPVEEFENRQAVAVTIEQSYDDWCIAQLAKALGKKEDAAYFEKRARNYLNVYNRETGFVHPRKADGSFVKEYNPKFCGGQGGRRYFAENNAYIYNFAAQHDIAGMVEMHGGKEAFAQKLDNLYVEQYDGVLKSTFLMQYPDATGLMGQFCMGNEPSFHIPYLYNFCGQAYKTQRKLHEILDLWFTNSPLGICGDEDGGAMSAFCAFSAMGFYTVTPGSDRYDLGSPIFDQIEIDLPNGKTFTIEAHGASQKAKYIQNAEINGSPLSAPYFTHAQMLEGGTLKLTMSERPNKQLWA